jgi:putative membrane protein
MMILPLILIAGAVYFIYVEREAVKLQLQPCRIVDNSLNILNERFARGEISEDEYVRIRSALNNR